MKDLIKVDYTNDRPLVSARDLHNFLDVDTPFHKWFPRMCEYGFTENDDYSVTDIFVHNSAGGPQSKKEAMLTIDMAKEICMLQRNEKGKVARQYFIQLEKDWNSPEKIMARALRIADQKIQVLTDTVETQKQQISELAESKRLLIEESNTYDHRAIINSIMRSIASKTGSFKYPGPVFNEFYKYLRYKEHIDLKIRAGRLAKTHRNIKPLDCVDGNEVGRVVRAAIAFYESKGYNAAKLLGNTNYKLYTGEDPENAEPLRLVR